MADNTEKYKKMVERSAEIDSMDSAIEALDAFHKIETLGGDELEVLRFEYVNNCIENPLLERAFEHHLSSCFNCLQKTTNLKHFSIASDKYGDEVAAKIEDEESVELIQRNSGDPLRRNFIVRVNDKITEYEIAGNELNFYLYKAVGEIEDKNVTITKDDEIFFAKSFEEKDIRIYRLAADTDEAKDKKSKARIIKGVDFKRKPYRKINYRTYINPDEGYAKVIIELPS